MSSLPAIDLAEVARGLGLPAVRVTTLVELLDAGNTVPFITRYRKDQTGGLDEEQIRAVQERVVRLRQLAERKQTILRSIESQGQLTPELAAAIQQAETTRRLEDLYLPFKPKKQTLATAARNRGLEPLALEILAAAESCADLDARAQDFINPDKQLATTADVLLGAGHILAERFAERADLRERLRVILGQTGRISTTGIEPEKFAELPPATPVEAAVDGEAGGPPATTDPGSVEAVETDPAAVHEAGHSPVAEAVTAAPTSSVVTALAPEVEPADETPAIPAEAVASDTVANVVEPVASVVEPVANVVEPVASVVAPEVPSAVAETAAAVADVSTATVVPATVVPADDEPSPPLVESTDAPAEIVALPVEGAPPAADGASSDASDVAEITEAFTSAMSIAPIVLKLNKRKLAQQQEKAKRKAKQASDREKELRAFRDYFQYSEALDRIPPHRVLAINRGEHVKALRVRVEADLEAMHSTVDGLVVPAGHPHADFLRGCGRDALLRLVWPSLEREVRRELTDAAERHAVDVFARNLRNLLLQPPVRDKRLLAIDPGFKSGCKLVALDEFGNLLDHGLIHLIGKEERRVEKKSKYIYNHNQNNLNVIVIGNGTACRQVETWVADLLGGDLAERGILYVIVNEAGASVYSTSPLGRAEFPHYDATLRGAISIGRRLQDPLSELVKIDPANIGVGMYQHDVKARHLRDSLDAVVESCVNYVGVDVNTASPALLRYVSGLNQLTAQRVYDHRQANGPFKTREQLKQVSGLGETTFVQAAGFLKIVDGDNPLDATWIHPESYAVAEQLLGRLETQPADLLDKERAGQLAQRTAELAVDPLADELHLGRYTLQDIVAQLARPGRDPRESLSPPVFKRGVLKIDDLAAGMELAGTVLNVVDFGAFVDIGLKDCGLVHISQLADRYVQDPHEVVSVGDVVKVWVLEVDKQRRRVSLTMIQPGTRRPAPPRRGRGAPATDPATGQSVAGQPAPGSDGGTPTPRPPSAPPANRPPRPRFRPQHSSEVAAGGGAQTGSGQAGGGGQGQGRPGGRGGYGGQNRRGGGGGQQGGQSGGRPGRGGPGGQQNSGYERPPAPPPKPPKPMKQKPLVPLTEAMKKGKEPMRTFGDLLQFMDAKSVTPPDQDQNDGDAPPTKS